MMHLYPDLITCLALWVYAWTFVACGRARATYGVKAPATTGHPEFEKRFRVQQNTLEQLVLFLPALWVFSTTVSQFWSGPIGLVWILGRIVYGVSYARNPELRGPGFIISLLATVVLLVGATVRTVMIIVTGAP